MLYSLYTVVLSFRLYCEIMLNALMDTKTGQKEI